MISRATMNLKPVVIELDGGPIWKSLGHKRHLLCKPSCPLYPRKRHSNDRALVKSDRLRQSANTS